MDEKSVDFKEETFKVVKARIESLAKSISFKASKLSFVPVSSWLGDNIVRRTTKMPWYTGPTLLEALDSLHQPKTSLDDDALRIVVHDQHKVNA